jgi:hypothetical protein
MQGYVIWGVSKCVMQTCVVVSCGSCVLCAGAIDRCIDSRLRHVQECAHLLVLSCNQGTLSKGAEPCG